jgi:hypothetical protein
MALDNKGLENFRFLAYVSMRNPTYIAVLDQIELLLWKIADGWVDLSKIAWIFTFLEGRRQTL